jgi:porin
MRTKHFILALAAMLGAQPLFAEDGSATVATGQETKAADATLFPIPKLSGPIWERERLLGDLGGPRQTLADHGVQLEFGLVQVYQGVVGGGSTEAWSQAVTQSSIKALTGALVDPVSQRLEILTSAQAQQRINLLSKGARLIFARLPEGKQEVIRKKIAFVPAAAWSKIATRVDQAFVNNVDRIEKELAKIVRGRAAGLTIGSFDNNSLDRLGYQGSWKGELMLDLHKMGLWQGGFIYADLEGQYGDSVSKKSGALSPLSVDGNLPEPGIDDVTVPFVFLTQFLSEKLAVTVGKIPLQYDNNEFAYITRDERFLGAAFAINLVTARSMPYSSLGATINYLPTKDLTLMFTAYDADGLPTRSGFDTVFNGITGYAGEGRLTTRFGGLTGHHTLGGTYVTGSMLSLDQNPLALIPGTGVDLKTRDSTWCVYYNFDQYLWQPDRKKPRGFGVFGRVGFADEKTSPSSQYYSFGFGGKGAFQSRPYDRWGVGGYYLKTSRDLPDYLQFGDEKGVEAFYTFAVTPACLITADVQVVNSARKDVDTATIIGMRVTMRF